MFVDTQYAICSCSGKAAKVSNPYRSGDAIYWTETKYDGLGRVTKVIPPDGTSTSNNLTYTYDYPIRATTVTDPAGKQKKYDYDILMRLWRVTEPDSSEQLTLTTTYEHLPSNGQPGLVITQGSQTRSFVYDTLGRTISETHPESGTTTYAYDDNGNLTQKTDARGWVTNYCYDELNRLTAKTYQNDGGVTQPVSIAYDTATNGVGRMAGWTAGAHSGSRSYDVAGRVVSESRTIAGDSQTAQWSYGLGGQLLTTTYPNSVTTANGYDAVGNLETIGSSFGGNLVTNIDRNAAGAWTLVAYGNGVSNTRTFNNELQLLSLRVSAGTDYFYKTYGYNEGVANNGLIASIADNLDSSKSISYTYDELNRLATAATSGSDWGLAWGYDRYNNRLSQTVTKGSAPANSVTVNTATNRVSAWTYDVAGNVTNDGANTYAYDAENRIISVNSAATTYSYDAFGSRVTKATGTTTVRYYFGLAEKTDSAWTKNLTATPAGVVEWDGSAVLFKSNDHRGNAAVITDASGSVAGRVDLFPYGEVCSQTGTTTKYKLTDKERDAETGLDYFGARYYSSSPARWLSADILATRIYDPQSLNKYTYVRNDPVNLVDPDGRQAERPGRFSENGVFIPDNPITFTSRSTSGSFGYGGASMIYDIWARITWEGTWIPYISAGNAGQAGIQPRTGSIIPSLTGADKGLNKAFQKAYTKAMNLLKKEKCANLFNGSGATVLSGASFECGVVHTTAAPVNLVLAITNEGKQIVVINSQSHFFSQVECNSDGSVTDYGIKTGLSGTNFQAFILLHELGHLTGIFPEDPDGGTNWANSKRVLSDCFGIKKDEP